MSGSTLDISDLWAERARLGEGGNTPSVHALFSHEQGTCFRIPRLIGIRISNKWQLGRDVARTVLGANLVGELEDRQFIILNSDGPRTHSEPL